MICRPILRLSQTFRQASEAPATSAMIFSNYREIVTPKEAERYWNIFPGAAAVNIVSMAQAS
jgi:hypothetical protein